MCLFMGCILFCNSYPSIIKRGMRGMFAHSYVVICLFNGANILQAAGGGERGGGLYALQPLKKMYLLQTLAVQRIKSDN